tara:strand:+ start:2840 stop:2944 length:105 start_codon:yes stop_codon:yes gene_type:complete
MTNFAPIVLDTGGISTAKNGAKAAVLGFMFIFLK